MSTCQNVTIRFYEFMMQRFVLTISRENKRYKNVLSYDEIDNILTNLKNKIKNEFSSIYLVNFALSILLQS